MKTLPHSMKNHYMYTLKTKKKLMGCKYLYKYIQMHIQIPYIYSNTLQMYIGIHVLHLFVTASFRRMFNSAEWCWQYFQ